MLILVPCPAPQTNGIQRFYSDIFVSKFRNLLLLLLLLVCLEELPFYGDELLDDAQSSRWSTTSCRLSAAASVYSHLPSISGGHLWQGTHLTWAMEIYIGLLVIRNKIENHQNWGVLLKVWASKFWTPQIPPKEHKQNSLILLKHSLLWEKQIIKKEFCSWLYEIRKKLKMYTIWGFYGSDYEECRLLGYKNPVRTSQETHYVSAKVPSQVGSYGGDYEECRLGCYSAWLL
jgi:hypothetical protein